MARIRWPRQVVRTRGVVIIIIMRRGWRGEGLVSNHIGPLHVLKRRLYYHSCYETTFFPTTSLCGEPVDGTGDAWCLLGAVCPNLS